MERKEKEGWKEESNWKKGRKETRDTRTEKAGKGRNNRRRNEARKEGRKERRKQGNKEGRKGGSKE